MHSLTLATCNFLFPLLRALTSLRLPSSNNGRVCVISPCDRDTVIMSISIYLILNGLEWNTRNYYIHMAFHLYCRSVQYWAILHSYFGLSWKCTKCLVFVIITILNGLSFHGIPDNIALTSTILYSSSTRAIWS